MSERGELVAICEMLDISNINSQTDIELLRSILSRLDDPKSGIDVNKLSDSLAFPQRTRDNINLSNTKDFWNELKEFNDLLKQDYTYRRQMLLNRLDCTVESFKWKGQCEQNRKTSNSQNKKQSQGQNDKSPNELIQELYESHRTGLTAEPDVNLSHLLALRETECDELLNSVVSVNTVDCKVAYKVPTKCRQHQQNDYSGTLVNLKQIIIPDVPDRGGRPCDHKEPPKETYSRHYQGRRR